MLMGMRRKIETVKQVFNVKSRTTGVTDEQKNLEMKEESRRIRSDFKHYLRNAWKYKYDQQADKKSRDYFGFSRLTGQLSF